MNDFQKPPPAHVIRLRGPAQLVSHDQQPPPIRVKTPCDIDPGTDAQCTVERKFGAPTGIDSNQRIELSFSGFKNVVAASLNETPLATDTTHGEFTVDVTDILSDYNKLQVTFSVPGFFGDLELRILE